MHSKEPSSINLEFPTGTQTLMRGLMLLHLVANGINDVKRISEQLNIPRSTAHRVLGSLVKQGYLRHMPNRKYLLGHRLIGLGAQAQEQMPLFDAAKPELEKLSDYTGDIVHLGLQEGQEVFYLDKINSRKTIKTRSRIGTKMPLASTGIGKALMLSLKAEQWRTLYDKAIAAKKASKKTPLVPEWDNYVEAMNAYCAQGWVYDMEENEKGIRCIASPIRDHQNNIVAAISIASAAPYMSKSRMTELGPIVLRSAQNISRGLGWMPEYRK